jgi:hypothetical protein
MLGFTRPLIIYRHKPKSPENFKDLVEIERVRLGRGYKTEKMAEKGRKKLKK